MKNLGKKILFLLFISLQTLYGSVTAKVEPAVIYQGDTARFVLTVEGKEVNKPILDTICGYDILASSSQTSITMVNMEYKKSYVLSYTFAPQKNCTIEPIVVEVDGKLEKSNPVKVVVKPPQHNRDADFILRLLPAKKEVLVGEPFGLKLELKQKKSAEVVDSKFIAPDFTGFWIKSESPAQRTETDEYIITTMEYRLAAQREGNLTIKPAQLQIASRANQADMWGSFMPQIRWKNYFSNEVVMQVKPLPAGVTLVGDFQISASADKTDITQNEAVNVVVKVVGDGNLEDIESFKPSLEGVNVFAQKIKIEGNVLTQKLAFVSDKDFTIPAFSLLFYNLKTKKIQRVSTEPIAIHVKGAKSFQNQLQIQKSQELTTPKEHQKKVEEQNVGEKLPYSWLGGMFFLGILVGAALMYILGQFPSFKKQGVKNFSPKDEKQLLIRLLPYKESDAEVATLLKVLEEKLYEGKNIAIDKQLLKRVLRRYKLS
jgi:hypothetical protein